MKDIIFISERGWQGTRECAFAFAKQGQKCHVLVKGRPSREVRNFISPDPYIVNHFIPIKLFYIYFPLYLLLKKIFCKVGAVLVERPNAVKVVNAPLLKVPYYRIQETDEPPYYLLSSREGKSVSLGDILKSL